MADIRGIEHLPQDSLRDILTRVAGAPGGATDLARTFSVSKTFRSFETDEAVLRAVCFRDLLPYSDGRYELLSDLDGLVARCARAGNLNAELILPKVVIVCASMLSNAIRGPSDLLIPTENRSLNDLGKAARLIKHFTAQHTNPAELLVLIRNFLYRAELRDLLEMARHLQDFPDLFMDTEKKPAHEQFLTILVNSFDNHSLEMLTKQPSFIDKFNALCIRAYSTMKNMGMNEDITGPLLNCSVQFNHAEYETMIERIEIAMSILIQGSEVASTLHNNDAILSITDTLNMAALVCRYFERLIDHEEYLEDGRHILLLSFDSLFGIKQGSSSPEAVDA